tara:strand:- start:1381 stop:1698 length:318 start_codon:yes stop_codon:yes gene_type:complete
MSIHKVISNTVAQTLVEKNTAVFFKGRIGGVNKVTMTNVHASAEPVMHLFIQNPDVSPVETYTIAKTKIPVNTTLVLSDNVSFDGTKYSLKVQADGTVDCHVIVK